MTGGGIARRIRPKHSEGLGMIFGDLRTEILTARAHRMLVRGEPMLVSSAGRPVRATRKLPV